MTSLTLDQYRSALAAQNVPDDYLAFICPVCGTVQCAADFMRAGAGASLDDVDKFLGFSCVGRWTDAGPHVRGAAPDRGCNWTLGGLLPVHRLEVLTPDGRLHPRFEVATPDQAAQHMAALLSAPAAALSEQP